MDYYLIGRLDNHADRSGFNDIKQVFAYHKQNQKIYRDLHADCDTVILTEDHWGGQGAGDLSEFFGIYRALTESHQFFDVLFMSRVNAVGLAKYKHIIIPQVEVIDDKAAALIDQAISQGKTLLVSGKSGIKNEHFQPRNENALKCLQFIKQLTEKNVRGAYFEINHKEVFAHLNDTDLVAIDGQYLYAEYPVQTRRFMKLLPPQPFGPPERCYPVFPASEYPALVTETYGKGRVVYIPWNPGRLFYRQGYKNTFDFLTDIFEKICCLKPVAGNIPPTMEVTLLVDPSKQFRVLHFINNNGHFGNSFYPPSAVVDINCSLKLACDAVQSVTSLVTHQPIAFSFVDQQLSITINKIACFEALEIRS